MGNRPDVLTQVVHYTDKVSGNVSYTANGFRAITGLQAFRDYDWMTDIRGFNSTGNNFRGMVVSARWGAAYDVISPAAKVIGNVATVASIASNLIAMAPQFEQVYNSNDPGVVKAQKYSLLTSIVAQKTLLGVVTGGVHLIYLPLIVGCGAVAKNGKGKVATAAGVCSQVVNKADALVQSTANYLTSPDNQEAAIQYLVTIRIK